MNKYIFLTTEGYTYQPNSKSIEPDCDNAQLIGIVEGINQEYAFKNLLDNSPDSGILSKTSTGLLISPISLLKILLCNWLIVLTSSGVNL